MKSGINQIHKVLASLPDEKERGFEIALTNLVEDVEDNDLRKELSEILKANLEDEALAYPAFYCLSILYRRKKDITLLGELIEKYEGTFRDHPTFSHVYVLYLKEKGIGRDVMRVIQKSYEAYTKLNNNAGVVHNFAETIASAYEDSDNQTRELIKKEWLAKASEAIDLAIELDRSYAKYYCTKGRLLAIDKKYTEAKEAVKRAIDYEDSGKKDYVIRLGNYQHCLLLIQTEQYSEEISKQIADNENLICNTNKQIDEKFKENNIKNLEFLGFFAAIVSFTIGSIQIINNQPFEQARNLIIILFAALLSSFSGFGFLLHGLGKKAIPNVIMFLIGVGTIIVINYVI